MAEIIGVVSGILTIVKSVRMALEVVGAFYNAPEEISSLQLELERFSILIHELQESPHLSNSMLNQELSRSCRLVAKLQKFINKELLKGGLPSRRAWVMKTRKIKDFHAELAKEMSQLTLVLVSFNSISITAVAFEAGLIAESMTGLRRSINTISHTLQSLPFRLSSTHRTAEQAMKVSNASRSSTTLELDSKQIRCLDPSPPAHPAIATPLEISANFYPEQYTNSSRTQQLKVYYMIEKSSCDTERVNEYHLWYSERPRKWRTIIVEVTAKRTSKLWPICQSPRSMSSLIAAPLLPIPIQKQIEDRVGDLVPCDYASLSFELDEGSGAQNVNTRPEVSCLKVGFYGYGPRQLLDFVRDLGCPILYESEVAPQHFPNANMFVSSTTYGTICIEHKIDPSICCREDIFQQTKLLHCLKCSPHVVSFVGAVVDDKCTSVKSYLTAPTSMTLGTMLGLGFSETRRGLPLATRLAWAQQIVTGIRDVHQMGFVVGLATHMDIRIDHLGNAQLAIFRSNIRPEDCYRNENPGHIAPEQKLSENRHFKCTSRTDLYQLGGVLRLLAHFCEERSRICFESEAGCPKCRPGSLNSIIDRVTLPWAEECMPRWYSRMIEICLSPRPEDRLPASALLAMFPRSLASEPVEITLPPEIREVALVKTTEIRRDSRCNRCAILTSGWHYHCNLCFWGDYDICQSCVASGLHCDDESHFLGLRRWNGFFYENTEQYHSKVVVDEEKRDNILVFK